MGKSTFSIGNTSSNGGWTVFFLVFSSMRGAPQPPQPQNWWPHLLKVKLERGSPLIKNGNANMMFFFSTKCGTSSNFCGSYKTKVKTFDMGFPKGANTCLCMCWIYIHMLYINIIQNCLGEHKMNHDNVNDLEMLLCNQSWNWQTAWPWIFHPLWWYQTSTCHWCFSSHQGDMGHEWWMSILGNN